MKSYNFLIVHEVKAREFESACLLRYELERRGYSVKIMPQSIVYYYYNRIPSFNCDVLIAPWAYADYAVKAGLRHVNLFKTYVNLQWEQIWTIADDENPKHFGYLKETAKQCVHVSWGPYNANKLINQCGISEERIIKAGNITLDFLREEFKDFYMNKETLFKKYNLPLDKKVLLYISGFVWASKEVLDGVPNDIAFVSTDKSINLFHSIKAKECTLKLIDRLLDEHDDLLVIYRVHPCEAECEHILHLATKHENFRPIPELSVKQWILVSDKVYLWQSTAAVEAIYANKKCYVVGPNDLPRGLRAPIFEHAKYIESYEEFEQTVIGENVPSNIDMKDIYTRYGYTSKEMPTYIKICNALEDIYKNKKFVMPKESVDKLYQVGVPKSKWRRKMEKSIIFDIAFFMAKNTTLKFKLLDSIRRNIKNYESDSLKMMATRFQIGPNEIDNVTKGIADALRNKN